MTAAIAAKHNLKLWRINFVGAYLNSLTKEDIYMKQPEGFVEPGYEDDVAKLIHTIYSTMQGGHDWYQTLSGTYDDLCYTTSHADPCVRFKKEGENYTLTDTYTGDTFGASSSDEEAKRRKDEIGKVWEIKDVGETKYFLGMRVQQDINRGIIVMLVTAFTSAFPYISVRRYSTVVLPLPPYFVLVLIPTELGPL